MPLHEFQVGYARPFGQIVCARIAQECLTPGGAQRQILANLRSQGVRGPITVTYVRTVLNPCEIEDDDFEAILEAEPESWVYRLATG